jgi:hypothetical protein
MDDIAREFLKRLEYETQTLLEKLKRDKLGVGFLTTLKEFDFHRYQYVRQDRDYDTDIQFQMLRSGVPRMIAGILSGIPKFEHPMLTFKSQEPVARAAIGMAVTFGFVEQGKRLAQGVLAGECAVERPEPDRYEFIIPASHFDMEQHEGEVENHYTHLSRKELSEGIEEHFGKPGTLARIDELLALNVRVFHGSFMGYDADPELDLYFFGLAEAELQLQSGYDTFNWRVEFGGVTVQKYMIALSYFLSLAMKHQRFAEALVDKAPEVQLHDILTITCDRQEFRASLFDAFSFFGPRFADYTPLTDHEADTILKVLTLRRDNLELLSHSMAPLPYLIEFSDTAWVKCVSGVQTEGMEFLLNSLRHNFPVEYDRHQQKREGSMQRALRRMLEDFIPDLRFIENVKIRSESRTLTDVDFAVVEESSGWVLLFQLKHQDHYRADMRRRSNRGSRLKQESAHWLDTMRAWLATTPSNEIRAALRLKSSSSGQTHRLVLLTRHFAHFLRDLDLGKDATYATWMQLYDALNRMRAEGRAFSLQSLFEILEAYMSHVMVRPRELHVLEKYDLGTISYRIRQRAADSDEERRPPPEEPG